MPRNLRLIEYWVGLSEQTLMPLAASYSNETIYTKTGYVRVPLNRSVGPNHTGG